MRCPFNFSSLVPSFSYCFLICYEPFTCCVFTVKKHPKLKSRNKTRVLVAIEYAKTIDDFDNLVDPRTLARHYLGPDHSPFVLHANKIEEKSEFSLYLPFSLLVM